MKPIRDMTLGEFGALVATHLASRRIHVVLSGGACVMLYAEGRYVSRDLDFIDTATTPRRTLKQALAELGFVEKGRFFLHPHSEFILDFPGPPLAVGHEPPREITVLRFSTGELRAISPTDCVKDRLANYFHWQDLQSLEQAVLVSQSHPMDMEELGRWSRAEGKLPQFDQIAHRLAPKPPQIP